MKDIIQNKALVSPPGNEPHAFAKFVVNAKRYEASIFETIAIGQTLGAWEDKHVPADILQAKVAKIVEMSSTDTHHTAVIAFPWNGWHGRLAWLLTLLYGKMSFYEDVQLADVWFSADCFSKKGPLTGPAYSFDELRKKVGMTKKNPLLMGILKPNVGMTAEKITHLYLEAAQAGVHILKDDEIRHDESNEMTLQRISMVANEAQKQNLRTLYAVHLQIDGSLNEATLKRFEDAGAHAFLVNTWIAGLGTVQALRQKTKLPIMSHPSLVGAFGQDPLTSSIHPQVTLGSLTRAAGADLSLFPSPYGSLGLQKEVALAIAEKCTTQENWPIKSTAPVPSAGIKPEHAPKARSDFGTDFVLNAGTAIFAGKSGVAKSIQEFRAGLYGVEIR